ncbi:MAG TPA: DUF5777 family beta-barrel protein [Thermoanaerobaculia bacterium]|nr:DUF5777 family beta-barrel protein [Thermoanaerobaculia bacterium]
MRALVPAALLAALLLAGPARAQTAQTDAPDPYAPVHRDPVGAILINGATPYTVGEHEIELLFTHRFQQPINDGGNSHNLWGIDNGADVGLGVEWGPISRLDFSLYRSSFQEDFELAAKYLVFEQAPRLPFTLAVRAGADLLRRPDVEDPNRPFVQLLLARQIVPGVNLLVSPSWVRDTPSLRNAFNVPLGLTLPLPGEGNLIEVEYIHADHDLKASLDAWHVAYSKSLGGHIFEIVLGNSRATTVDQMLGGDSAAGFQKRDVRLGFNIIRDFSYGSQ